MCENYANATIRLLRVHEWRARDRNRENGRHFFNFHLFLPGRLIFRPGMLIARGRARFPTPSAHRYSKAMRYGKFDETGRFIIGRKVFPIGMRRFDNFGHISENPASVAEAFLRLLFRSINKEWITK